MRPPGQICTCSPCAHAPLRVTCLPCAQSSHWSAYLLCATCLPQCSEPGPDLLAGRAQFIKAPNEQVSSKSLAPVVFGLFLHLPPTLACVQVPNKLSADEKRAAFNQELLSSCAGAAWLHAFESLREQCILPNGTAAHASGLYNMLPTAADVTLLQVPTPGESLIVL